MAEAVEVSCTYRNGLLPFAELVDVVADPYTIEGASLAEWAHREIAQRELEVPVRTRNAPVGADTYNEIASLVRQRPPALEEVAKRTTSAFLSDWAGRVRSGGLEYQFERFARYLRGGTLEPVMRFARVPLPDRYRAMRNSLDEEYGFYNDPFADEERLLRQEAMQEAEAWHRSSEEGWYYAD